MIKIKLSNKKFNKDSNDYNIIKPTSGTEIHSTIDMDSLFGHFEIDDFVENVTDDLVFQLDDNPNNLCKAVEIKTHYLLNHIKETPVLISSLPHLKIGVFETAFGILDIYIVFTDTKLNKFQLKNWYIPYLMIKFQ